MRKIFMAAFAAVSCCMAGAQAAPNLLTYQGRLKEGGAAVTGVRSVEISLCNDPLRGPATARARRP